MTTDQALLNREQLEASVASAEEAIKVRRIQDHELVVRLVKLRVASFYGLTVEEIDGRRRSAHLIWPRHLSMALAYGFTRIKCVLMGELFKRHHATVLYGYLNARDFMETEPQKMREARQIYGEISRDLGITPVKTVNNYITLPHTAPQMSVSKFFSSRPNANGG